VNTGRMLVPAVLAGALALALGASASAATLANGTQIRCVLQEGVNSATLTPGTDFKLHVDDPSQPGLAGAIVVGHVFDVTPPSGTQRARIGFLFDYIRFANGTKAPIHANVVRRNVTQVNTAQARQEQIKLSLPAMPNGTVTPGPVAWQIHLRPGASPSVTPQPKGNSGGYVYAQNPNETIVIPPGSPVTITLTASLDTP